MADTSATAKGFARGLGIDSVAWPIDTLESFLNLGLAGGGWAAHQLGMIDSSQLPTLLKGSPLTSEWLAKKLGNPDTGGKNYSTGRLMGNLAPLAPSAVKAAGGLAGKALDNAATRPQTAAQKGAILVPESWLNQYNIPDRAKGGGQLGRLDSGLAGEPYAALNRERTLSDHPFRQGQKLDNVPLQDISPEVKGTPLGGIPVSFDPTPKPVLGSYYPAGNSISINSALPEAQMLSTLHHEATHAAQALGKMPGRGSNVDNWTRRNPTIGVDELSNRGLVSLARDSRDLSSMGRKMPHQLYEGNLGEIEARVAGQTAPMMAPTSQSLQTVRRIEGQGKLPNVEMRIGDLSGTKVPISMFNFNPGAGFQLIRNPKTGEIEVRRTNSAMSLVGIITD